MIALRPNAASSNWLIATEFWNVASDKVSGIYKNV
jgi:hypothetical protein